MEFEKEVNRLRLTHKISVNYAIGLQNRHSTALQNLRNLNRRIEDIKNGHKNVSEDPKEVVRRLQLVAEGYKNELTELKKIVRDKKISVAN